MFSISKKKRPLPFTGNPTKGFVDLPEALDFLLLSVLPVPLFEAN